MTINASLSFQLQDGNNEKTNWSKNIETKHLSQLKLDINPFLPPNHYKYGGRFQLLVGYNI